MQSTTLYRSFRHSLVSCLLVYHMIAAKSLPEWGVQRGGAVY